MMMFRWLAFTLGHVCPMEELIKYCLDLDLGLDQGLFIDD